VQGFDESNYPRGDQRWRDCQQEASGHSSIARDGAARDVGLSQITFFPWQAGPAHPVKVVQHLGFIEFYEPLTANLVIVAAAWLLIRRSSRTRIYLFCAAWFGGTLYRNALCRLADH
jgi:hypothetical protein